MEAEGAAAEAVFASIVTVSFGVARRLLLFAQIPSSPFALRRPDHTDQIGTDPEPSDPARDIVRLLLVEPSPLCPPAHGLAIIMPLWIIGPLNHCQSLSAMTPIGIGHALACL